MERTRTSIRTLRFESYGGFVRVLINHQSQEISQFGIGIVSYDSHLTTDSFIPVASHIELEHSYYGTTFSLVNMGDGLRAFKATFLAGIKVEFEGLRKRDVSMK